MVVGRHIQRHRRATLSHLLWQIMRSTAGLACVVLSVAIHGCHPRPRPDTPPVAPVVAPIATPNTEAAGTASLDSKPIPQDGSFWIFADTQFHHIESKPYYSEFEDGLVEVAIRPPALDLFAPVLTESILQTMRERPERPIFFLGDAANLSCVDEYDRFETTTRAAPWLGVIGNHDGYFIGNLVDPGGVTKDWKTVCADGPQNKPLLARLAAWEIARFGLSGDRTYSRYNAMSKATAVALYLVGLQDRGLITQDPLTIGWQKLTDNYWHYTTTFKLAVKGQLLPVRLEAVVASTDTGAGDVEWDAYLLQDVLIPSRKTHVILIDTSDHETRPTGHIEVATARCWGRGRCVVPGIIGHVAVTQSKTILQWVKEAENNHEDFFVMGHHNWDSLSKQTVKIFKSLEQSKSFITYVSGHEHDPTAKVKAQGAREDWEVNIASVTDAPQQFAAIAYQPIMDNEVQATRLEVTAHGVESTNLVHDRCEIKYAPNQETCYFGESYHLQIRSITRLMIERLLQEPALRSSTCDEHCLQNMRRDLDKAPISTVTQFVRDTLLQSSWAKQQAFACAVQAGHFEREYSCGITFFEHRIKNLKKLFAPASVKKEPVDGGTEITQDTGTFTVHRGPSY